MEGPAPSLRLVEKIDEEGRKIKTYRAEELARFVNGRIEGDGSVEITGVSSVEQARKGQLAFVAQAAYEPWLERTPASAVLVGPGAPRGACPCIIRVANPYLAFVRIAREKFGLGEPRPTGIHPQALIHPDAELGREVSVGPFSVIEAGARIGDRCIIGAQSYIGPGAVLGRDCQIGNGVRIEHDVLIGDEVIIQSGSVVGSDGFGYVKEKDRYYKIPHVGRVVLEDRVEIGANCTIDRGTFGDTRIRSGTKLDNLVHVAHNVEIGENTVIAAQTGISGSTKIGSRVTIAGQVGFVGHITIGDDTVFGAQAGVTKSIPPGITVSGYPAKLHSRARREEAALRRLPEALKRLRKLEKLLAEHDPELARQLKEETRQNS